MAEGTSDMIEVPSEHDSGCNLDDNLYLHFNYSIQKKKRNYCKAKWVKRKINIGNGKIKIGTNVDLLSIKEKQNTQEKKQILSRPIYSPMCMAT